jgi:hypothetical protein
MTGGTIGVFVFFCSKIPIVFICMAIHAVCVREWVCEVAFVAGSTIHILVFSYKRISSFIMVEFASVGFVFQ